MNIKKLSLLTFLLIFSVFSLSVFASEISVYVDGSIVYMENKPQIVNGTTLVPMRAVAEAMGANVQWNAEAKQANIYLNDTIITLTVDNSVIGKFDVERDENGKLTGVNTESLTEIKSEVPTQIINGSTYIPLRAMAEALDCQVNWEAETKTITITTAQTVSSSENIIFTVNGDVLTISGKGRMEDFAETKYYEEENTSTIPTDIKEVVVEEGITYIGAYSFKGCTELEKVTLPDTVTEIGAYAFQYCESLKEINLPEGITRINEFVFQNCEALEKIVLPESLESVGRNLFCNCYSLKTANIPGSLKTIGMSMFLSCPITSMEIPSTVTAIEDYAFEYTNLEQITIPDTVTYMGENVFLSCKYLEEIKLSKNITLIGDFMFTDCVSLKSIAIPNKVTSIGAYAFSGCTNLNTITIPESVTAIGRDAFKDCSSLESVICVKDSTADNQDIYPEGTTLYNLDLSSIS